MDSARNTEKTQINLLQLCGYRIYALIELRIKEVDYEKILRSLSEKTKQTLKNKNSG